jgi:hypothetical protein
MHREGRWARGQFKQNVSAAAYRLTRGNLAKAQFRMDWAKACFNTAIREKTETRQKSHTDFAKGMYDPFAVIVEKEGGKASRQ